MDVRRPYDAFGLYVHLEHDGDFRAASDALEAQGYGTKVIALTSLIARHSAPEGPTGGDGEETVVEYTYTDLGNTRRLVATLSHPAAERAVGPVEVGHGSIDHHRGGG